MKTDNRGFTLLAALTAVLIAALLSLITVTCVQLAVASYKRTVDYANARTLLSAGMVMLRDEIASADNVTLTGNVLSYKNEGIPSSVCFAADGSGELRKTTFGEEKPFMQEITVDSLTFACDTIEKTDTAVIFGNLCIKKDGRTLASIEKYTVLLV